MLDQDLAVLYGVETRALVQAAKRNAERFPGDFMFQLKADEVAALRSQLVILKSGRGQHRKYLPYAFTEHGALMLGNVLRSPRAVAVSLLVVRAFVRLRAVVASHRELAAKMDELERKLATHDQTITELLEAIRELMLPAPPSGRPIGFTANIDDWQPE
ncbi:MAG TPA: ORF6N domain-containing protein [Gammaproteobacteria bacterium]|nr:ORF6N domain-containing protein [Gammaproteobacteria bacterium]